jgi:pilus assembly protein Flp/PilA
MWCRITRSDHGVDRITQRLVGARRIGARRNVMNAIAALRSLVRRDEGQDLLEYALLVSLIALVAVAAIKLAGTNVNTIFEKIAAAL